MKEAVGVFAVLAVMIGTIIPGASSTGKVPVTTKVTQSSSVYGPTMTEICYNGIVYIVYGAVGITPKINRNNHPHFSQYYSCTEESSK